MENQQGNKASIIENKVKVPEAFIVDVIKILGACNTVSDLKQAIAGIIMAITELKEEDNK